MTSIQKTKVNELKKEVSSLQNVDKIERMKKYIALDTKKIETYKQRILKLHEWNKLHQTRLNKLVEATK